VGFCKVEVVPSPKFQYHELAFVELPVKLIVSPTQDLEAWVNETTGHEGERTSLTRKFPPSAMKIFPDASTATPNVRYNLAEVAAPPSPL